MGIKVKITSNGIEAEEGSSGIDVAPSTNNSNLTPYNLSSTTLSATTVPSVGGLYYVSGDSIRTLVMPAASTVPGAMYVFRRTSNHTHILTGSNESQGTLVFSISGSGAAIGPGSSNGNGSALAFSSSVVLISDGAKFLTLGFSGSLTFTGA